jgi:hypothetical protein
MVIVGKGVDEAEADAGADVGDDSPRDEVADAGVRVIGVLREPSSGVVG